MPREGRSVKRRAGAGEANATSSLAAQVCEQSALVLNLSFKHRKSGINRKDPYFCCCSKQSKKSYILWQNESFKKRSHL